MVKLNILSRFFSSSNDVFYEYFEENSHTCKQTAELFLKVLKDGVDDDSMVTARQYKHKSNKLLKKTLKVLNQIQVTPIEREDIQNISSMLNRITKKIIKAIMNFKVYRIEKSSEHMILQAKNLLMATDELDYIMKNFRNKTSVSQITDRNLKMKEIETRGDEIHYQALDELFSGEFDALTVIKFRDIYKDIETALDTCYHVSDAVTNIMLK